MGESKSEHQSPAELAVRKSSSAAMPLRFRIPAILAGIAILWWVMNGGASVLINSAVENIARPNRSIGSAHVIALEKRPEGTAWLDGLLGPACSEDSPVAALRGLDYVIFSDGVSDASLPEGIHSGCFYDEASKRAFFDVACLASIDQFARPRPDLVKSFAVAIVLAGHTAKGAGADALVAEAGRLANALKFFPPGPGARSAAGLGLHPMYLGIFDKRRNEDTPPGWINHPMLPALEPDEADASMDPAAAAAKKAARLFSAGLTP